MNISTELFTRGEGGSWPFVEVFVAKSMSTESRNRFVPRAGTNFGAYRKDREVMPFLHTQLNGEDVIVVVTNEPSATEADIRQLIASAEPYLVQTMKELAQPIGEDLLDGLRKSEYWQMSKDKTTGRLYSLALLPHYDKGEEEVRVGIYAKLEIDTDTENGVELIQDHYTPGEDRAFYKAALRFT